MSNNWIKKVHQSFCSLEDKSSYDEIQFYCNYSDKVLSEMDSLGYEDCNFKNNNLKFLLKLIKKYSKFPYLIFSLLESENKENFIKHRFWNGRYFCGNINSIKLEKEKIKFNKCYLSILLDINAFSFFDNDLYMKSLIETGKFFCEVERMVTIRGGLCCILNTNSNSITKSLNFNVSEVMHFISIELEI